MHDFASMMVENNEAVQYLEPDSWNCEEINGSDPFDVVLKKGSPCL